MSIKLINIISNKVHLNDFTIKLTLDDINYLSFLIQKTPEIFDYIELQIHQLKINNKISFHELPNIILLTATLLKKNIIKNNIPNLNLINIIKFIIDTSILLIPLNNNDNYIVKLVIDTSLKLLIFELNIYETYESSFLYSRLCC